MSSATEFASPLNTVFRQSTSTTTGCSPPVRQSLSAILCFSQGRPQSR
jgi:hypothetical protein